MFRVLWSSNPLCPPAVGLAELGAEPGGILANELPLMKMLLVLKQLKTCRPGLTSMRWAELRDAWDAVLSQLTTKILVLTTGLFKVDLNGVI